MASNSAAFAAGLETARTLVQRVSRAFYDARQCIVLDQLIRKEAMRDEELAGRVGMPTRDLAKIAQRLIEDQIISQHRRQEIKEGAPKAQQRAYYYMDYSHATDVIKWRMFKIQEIIDVKLRNELDSQGYVCPQCRKSFTPLDAAQILDPYRGCFVCDVCNTELVNNENEEEVRGSKDRMQRLVEQTRVIRDLLKKMDDVVLPRFDVIKWLELNGPAGGTAVAEGPTVGPSGAVRIELAGDDDEAIMKAKREADAIEKRAANQLPSWIAQSTVSGEASTAHLEAQPTLPSTSSKADIKPSVSLLNPTETSSAELDLDAYYASLASAPLSPSRVALPPSRADSPLFSPLPIPSAVKEEEGSEDEFDEIGVAVQDAFGADEVPKGSGKRSRDEVDSGWEEGGDEWEGAGKKARVEEEVERAPEEDEDEEEFDEVGGEGDPNPLIAVGDKMVPFDEVGEELQAAMTPDEYTAYWDVWQRLN